MFCQNCGNKLEDNTPFCPMCGNLIVGTVNDASNIPQINNKEQVHFVPAKCTNCGGALKVDTSKEAAICPYCNQPFIVEKAINNYNISISGNVLINNANISVEGAPTISNLLARARAFEKKGDIKSAIAYYNRVLDIDISCKDAQDSLERILHKPFATVNATKGFSQGILTLEKDKLVYTTTKGKIKIILFSEIRNVRKSFGSLAITTNRTNSFSKTSSNPNGYVDEVFELKGGRKIVLEWVDMINSALAGRYPSLL